MSPRTVALPPSGRTMWRKLLAKAHPDAGGDHDLFVWAGAVRDVVCNSSPSDVGSPEPEDHSSRRREDSTWRPTHTDETPRIPYPSEDSTAFEEATSEALRMAEELGTFNLYGGILAMLEDCQPMARYAHQQERGASYKQLAAIGHTVGMSGAKRSGWYAVAKGVPLSDRHAGHILGRLKSAAA